jgi:hypothetical protein
MVSVLFGKAKLDRENLKQALELFQSLRPYRWADSAPLSQPWLFPLF